jgi:hypothetical protein
VHVEQDFQEARFSLEDAEIDIQRAATAVNSRRDTENSAELKKCIEILQQKVAAFDFSSRSTTRSDESNGRGKASDSHSDEISKLPTDTVEGLVALHVRLITAQTRAAAADERWNAHLNRAKLMEDMLRTTSLGGSSIPLLSSVNSDDGADDIPEVQSAKSCCKCQNNSCNVKNSLAQRKSGVLCMRYTYRALSLLCTVASALVLWYVNILLLSHISTCIYRALLS